MSANKILVHVFNDVPHHYNSFIKFFSSLELVGIEQRFLILSSGHSGLSDLSPDLQTLAIDWYSDVATLRAHINCCSADYVIFHGLWLRLSWQYLALSHIHHKTAWVCWGADIHDRKRSRFSPKELAYRLLRGVSAGRLNCVLALNKGDLAIVKAKHGIKNGWVQPYPITGVSGPDKLRLVQRDKHSTFRVLIGNSADPSNNHLSILDDLAHFADENIELIVPLNYAGKPDYIKQVVDKGMQLFGEKFTPLLKVIPKSSYDELLSTIDITVFAHERQQGLYAAYYMLLHGRKLFLNSQCSSSLHFHSLGLSVSVTEEIKQSCFSEFVSTDEDVMCRNADIAKKEFTEEALAERWISTIYKLLPVSAN